MEFIVNASASVKLAQLVTLNILSGVNGDDAPNRPIFNMQLLAEDPSETAAAGRVGRFSTLKPNQKRFAGLAAAPIAVKRVVFFNENQPTRSFMDVQGQPEMVFNPNAAPAITATQGTVEEWTVENHTQENHEFHFHQLHFLVESRNNFSTATSRRRESPVNILTWSKFLTGTSTPPTRTPASLSASIFVATTLAPSCFTATFSATKTWG